MSKSLLTVLGVLVAAEVVCLPLLLLFNWGWLVAYPLALLVSYGGARYADSRGWFDL